MFPDAVKKYVVFSFVFMLFVPQDGIAQETHTEKTQFGQTQEIGLPKTQPLKNQTEAPHKISLSLKKADLLDVLNILAKKTRWNLVIGQEVSGVISLNLHDVMIEDALAAVVRIAGYAIERKDNILHVTTPGKVLGLPFPERIEHKAYRLSSADVNEAAQIIQNYLSPYGKLTTHKLTSTLFIDDIPEVLKKIESVVRLLNQAPSRDAMPTRTYRLSYVKAEDAGKVIKAYLSPFGKLTLHKTGETLFIEDTPKSFERIERVLREMDRPPKQVMIEARILEIQINDDLAYGVDWDILSRSGNKTATAQTSGFSRTASSGGEGLFFGLATPEIKMLLNALEKKGNLNTLATPKLLALNHKPARIVIGGRLGFKVTTTTNLVTQESVEFLDTGTQLKITPHIDDRGNILMDIHPEVSDGVIIEGLPSKTTTEVTTSLMAKDGESIFIGGLIRERQEEITQKVPILGSIPLLGFFFSRTEIKKLKSEIIVVITPHIVQQDMTPAFTTAGNEPQTDKDRYRKSFGFYGHDKAKSGETGKP